MALTVSIEHDNFPKDHPIDVGGILVPNYGSTELTDEQEQLFVATHGKSVKDVFKDTTNIKVEGKATVSGSDMSELVPETVSDTNTPTVVDDTSEPDPGGEKE